jgi:hypothetical protein
MLPTDIILIFVNTNYFQVKMFWTTRIFLFISGMFLTHFIDLVSSITILIVESKVGQMCDIYIYIEFITYVSNLKHKS